MALSNYTELQAAVRTEMANVSTGGLSADALEDCIARAESVMNRTLRLREMEQLSYASYNTSGTTVEDRRIALPADYVEFVSLFWKVGSNADTSFEPAIYVAPEHMPKHYGDTGDLYFTLHNQIEFNRNTGGSEYELMMHFFKQWDIAGDSTNWLLTNYPDCYLYGACAEAAIHMRSEVVAMYKQLFTQAMSELNELSSRGRDDSQLDTSELAGMNSRTTYNILTG